SRVHPAERERLVVGSPAYIVIDARDDGASELVRVQRQRAIQCRASQQGAALTIRTFADAVGAERWRISDYGGPPINQPGVVKTGAGALISGGIGAERPVGCVPAQDELAEIGR